jgi:hypothetical protein
MCADHAMGSSRGMGELQQKHKGLFQTGAAEDEENASDSE